jgi:hypothetical protein
MEKVLIQGLATPESGRCDGRFNRTPTLSKVGNMTGAEGR